MRRLVVAVDQASQAKAAEKVVGKALGMLGASADVRVVAASPTVGQARPKIAEVREYADDFWAKVLEECGRRGKVLAMGAIATTQMARSRDRLPITEWRGMMTRDEETGVVWVPTGSAVGVLSYPDMFVDTIDDVGKILWQSEPRPLILPDDGTVDWEVATTPVMAMAYLAEMVYEGDLSCDIETLGLDPNRDGITQVGFGALRPEGRSKVRAVRGRAVLEDPQVADLMWDLVFSKSHTTVMHNATFDLKFLLAYYGMDRVPTGARIGDTMLLHHQLDERPVGKMAGSAHSLKTLARVWYDQPDYSHDIGTWQQRYKAGTLTPEEERDFDWYHARDCHFTISLWHDLGELADRDMPGARDFHAALLGRASAVIAGCELRGVPMDVDVAGDMMDGMGKSLRRVERRLLDDKLVGDREVTLGSPDSIRRLLMGDPPEGWGLPPQEVTKAKTKAGQANKTGTTDMTHLRALRRWCDAHDRQAESDWIGGLLDYRQDAKDVQGFLEPLMEAAQDDGRGWRVHPRFWLAGTVTGRLSSSSPSVQNMPGAQSAARGRPRKVKNVFRPGEGWSWLECDYSQLELRIAAALCQDPGLIETFDKGIDLHRVVAATMYQKAESDVTGAERFTAKAIDFGILYGRSAWAVSKDEEIARMLAMADPPKPAPTEEEAKIFIDRFLDKFPRLREWLDEVAAQATKQGWIPIGPGRRRRFYWQDRDRSDWRAKKHMNEIQRQARNGPIQGLASDVCLDAFCRIEAALPKRHAEILFPVHDSVCMIVRDEALEDVIAMAKETMSTPPSWHDMAGVPLTVDAKAGPSWGECGDL